jgi:hypothetical protein
MYSDAQVVESVFTNHPIILHIAGEDDILFGDVSKMRQEDYTPRLDFMNWVNSYARTLTRHNPDVELPENRFMGSIAYAVLSARSATRGGFADVIGEPDEEHPDVSDFIREVREREEYSVETLDAIIGRYKRL